MQYAGVTHFESQSLNSPHLLEKTSYRLVERPITRPWLSYCKGKIGSSFRNVICGHVQPPVMKPAF
jgi:hypothetical protein